MKKSKTQKMLDLYYKERNAIISCFGCNRKAREHIKKLQQKYMQQFRELHIIKEVKEEQ